MLEKQQITSNLQKVIEEHLEIKINDPDDKLDIDSFTMTLIIVFVDEEIGVQLDMETLDFDAFTSLNTLADLVITEAKKNPSP
jgi:acyl carrier protein